MDNHQESGQIHYLNMKAIVRDTGLNPVTIRTWERRYGLPKPQRSEGGHRQYTQRDLEMFKWIIARQEEGLSVRHAIERWHSLAEEGLEPGNRATKKPPEEQQIAIEPTHFQPLYGIQLDEFRAQWIEACIAFDRKSADQILTQAFSCFPAETVCIKLLMKGVAEIGKSWYEGRITIQEEHFATALAVRRLESLVAAAPLPLRDKRIMIFCAPDDHHIFSPLLLTFLLLRRGWDVIYLGANIPIAALHKAVAQVEPAMIIISAQRLHAAANLFEMAHALRGKKPLIGFGGRVFNQSAEIRASIPGHFLGETLEIAVENIEALLAAEWKPQVQQTPQIATGNQQILDVYRARRAVIEAGIWETFTATNRPVENLRQISTELALAIMAALKLGNLALLGNDIQWVKDLLVSYRLPQTYLQDFLHAYHHAAKTYLEESATSIVDWLAMVAETE